MKQEIYCKVINDKEINLSSIIDDNEILKFKLNFNLFSYINKIDIRQDLLGSCAMTVIYLLFLYNRVKFLNKTVDFISIPYQRLIENKLVGKKTIQYYTDKYVFGIKQLGVIQHNDGIVGNIFSSIKIDKENRRLFFKFNNGLIDRIIITNVNTNGLITRISWRQLQDLKLGNIFYLKLFIELIKNFKLNKGKYMIKFSTIENEFNLKFPKGKNNIAENKKHFNRFFLKPFIKKVNNTNSVTKILNYEYIKNKFNEEILVISYKMSSHTTTFSSLSPISPSLYTTLDHHKVRSRAEAMIDDFLYHHNIMHSYEKRIIISGETIVCDFYLPQYDVYVEFWGMDDEKYLKRKEEKIKIYKENNFKLIGLENKDLNNLDESLLKKLKSLDK